MDASLLERRQVPLYLLAIALGAATGLLVPQAAQPLEAAITPVLGVLLYVTFLMVPFTSIASGFRSGRFLGALLLLNFLAAPVVVFLLSRSVADDQALLLGVLFVLLTPCVDYVVVFSGLAGGDSGRLVAATPLLMLAQILLLPVYLALFVGGEVLAGIEVAPFVEAFVFLIVIPLTAAVLTQLFAARLPVVEALRGAALGAEVPLMMLTLAVVVASQVHAVVGSIPSLLRVVPLYLAFLIVMPFVGVLVTRLARLDVPGARAVVFSGATRNSLVVLPLALALPIELSFAALVVVTQTLIELVGMVIYVRIIPKLLPVRPAAVAAHERSAQTRSE